MVSAPVYGNITAEDDYTHPLGPEPNFNESMYFNFFDNAKGFGGFMRIGNRANEKYAEVTLTLYKPDGTVLFNWKRPEIAHNDAFDAGGMKFETIEPLVKLRTTYQGSAVSLADPKQMGDPGQAFRENPHAKVSIDLLHEAVAPVYGGTRNESEDEDAEKGFGRAHYEQHMHVTGTVTIDGETTQIDAYGLRDHSWGPRYWQNIHSYRWLTCSFGPDLNLMVTEIRRTPEERTQGGVVIRGDKLERITSIDMDTAFEDENVHHQRMTAKLGLANGEELTLEGDVKGYIPLRNRRAGMVTHIGEGMTEYRLLGKTALGISEYLDQVQ
jgi:hypothetical protein